MFGYSWFQTAELTYPWTLSSRLILCIGLSLYVASAIYFIQAYWGDKV
jgi:hypothetical protein